MAKHATCNFSNLNDDAYALFRECHNLIIRLAAAETDLREKREDLLKMKDVNGNMIYADKKALNAALQVQRNAVVDAKRKAEDMCISTISRFMSAADLVSSDVYHFDIEAFLRNVGVISGEGSLKNSAMARIEALRALVVDRVRDPFGKRKKESVLLTVKAAKVFRNDPIEVFMAIRDGFVASGCFEFSSGQFIRVDFSKKEEVGGLEPDPETNN